MQKSATFAPTDPAFLAMILGTRDRQDKTKIIPMSICGYGFGRGRMFPKEPKVVKTELKAGGGK